MASALYQDNPNKPTALRPPSYWDAVKENLPHALRGFQRMPTNVMGFPVDMVNLVVGAEKPFLGSEYLAEKLNVPERTGHPTELGTEIASEFLLPTGQGLGRSALKAEELLGRTLKEKLPEVVGKHVPEPFRTPISGLNMIDAYHGSPHKFSKFSTESIGTGEGAQAYGHGLYFAENPKVAGQYAETLSRHKDATIKGVDSSVELPVWVANVIKNDGIDTAINEWTKRVAKMKTELPDSRQPWNIEDNIRRMSGQIDELKKIKSSGRVDVEMPKGNLYNVKLDVDKKELLDWDVELEKQGDILNKIPKKDRRVVEDFIEYEMSDLGMNSDLSLYTGGEFKQLLDRAWDYGYFPNDHILGSAQEVLTKEEAISVYLKSKGIKGIKYKDALSRFSKTEEPTNNIVIFDDSLVSIVDDAVK